MNNIDSTFQSLPEGSDMRQALSGHRQWLIAGLARAYGNSGAYDSAARMLELYGQYRVALPFYMQAKQWSDARRVWSSLPSSTPGDQKYIWLADKAITLYSQGKGWMDIDSSDKSILGSIASDSIASPSVYMARGVLVMLGMSEFHWPVPVLPTASNTSHSTQRIVQEDNNIFSFYPNPTTGSFTINAQSAGTLEIYNVQGASIAQYPVLKGKKKYELATTLSSGIYIGQYRSNDGKVAQTIRIIYHP